MSIEIKSEFECTVDQVFFGDGDTVKAGDHLMNLSVMKMLIPVNCTADGIAQFSFGAGDYVKQGDVLVEITE